MKRIIFFLSILCCMGFTAIANGFEFTYESDHAFNEQLYCTPHGTLEIQKWNFKNSDSYGGWIDKVTYYLDGKKIKTNKHEPFGLYYECDGLSIGQHHLKVKINFKTNGGAESYHVEFQFIVNVDHKMPERETDNNHYDNVEIGYSMVQCLEAWGEPLSKKGTTTFDGETYSPIKSETWYYKNGRYLLFKNDVLESFSDGN